MQICPNCNYTNRPGVVFCENCGTSLIGSAASVDTQSLDKGKNKPDENHNSAAGISIEEIKDAGVKGTSDFPKDGVLVLEFGEGTDPLILSGTKIILFGRRDAATGSIPDVDLTPFAGYRMGVSRRHAEIRPAPEGAALDLWDLGSSNGSFINGDRLISHRGYRISDGDEIRFGQLSVNVHFRRRVETKPVAAESEEAPVEAVEAAREQFDEKQTALKKPITSETGISSALQDRLKPPVAISANETVIPPQSAEAAGGENAELTPLVAGTEVTAEKTTTTETAAEKTTSAEVTPASGEVKAAETGTVSTEVEKPAVAEKTPEDAAKINTPETKPEEKPASASTTAEAGVPASEKTNTDKESVSEPVSENNRSPEQKPDTDKTPGE